MRAGERKELVDSRQQRRPQVGGTAAGLLRAGAVARCGDGRRVEAREPLGVRWDGLAGMGADERA